MSALERALTRVRGRVRLSRGHGGPVLDALLRRLRAGHAQVDDDTAAQLACVIESLTHAVRDAETERDRLRREPWRGLLR